MDDAELPGQIDDLVVRSAQPTASQPTPSPFDSITPSRIAPHEPNSPTCPPQTQPDTQTGSSLTGDGRNLDYNGANGPGGVSRAAPPEPPVSLAAPSQTQPDSPGEIEMMATPLIPDQPLPPGAPSSLAAAQRGELSTPSTGLSTPAPHEPSARAHDGKTGALPTSPAAGLNPTEQLEAERRAMLAENQRTGRAHPFKPSAPAQIAEFATMWYDAAYTSDQIARKYRTTERTLSRWREEFGLPDRFNALRDKRQADSVMGAASAAISGLSQAASIQTAMAKATGQPPSGPVVTPSVVDPARFDPLQDKEIVALIDDLKSEVRMITAHSDLQIIQRKFMKLAGLCALKMPTQSWPGLLVMFESMQRAFLNARRIESDIPASGADPVLLRKEAASQMMRELKSVLTPEEQATLSAVMQKGVDRLMAKGGDHASLTAGVEG